MLLREKLVRAELAAARAKPPIREVGANNHGPQVKKLLAEVGLPEGYAWCDAFQSYEEHATAGRRLPIESASVAQTYAKAKSLNWLALYPQRGDLVLYDFDGDGQTDDHIGIVVSATNLGVYWKLNTVEGNTGDGSAADGDGVYLRTRVVRKTSVAFVRIPGVAPAAPAVKKSPAKKKQTVKRKPAAKKTPATPTLKNGARGPAVRSLQTLLAKRGAKVSVDGVFGQRTKASVAAFQRRHGLTPDGVAGPKTWAKLRKAG